MCKRHHLAFLKCSNTSKPYVIMNQPDKEEHTQYLHYARGYNRFFSIALYHINEHLRDTIISLLPENQDWMELNLKARHSYQFSMVRRIRVFDHNNYEIETDASTLTHHMLDFDEQNEILRLLAIHFGYEKDEV